jgi:hypothetical protein
LDERAAKTERTWRRRDGLLELECAEWSELKRLPIDPSYRMESKAGPSKSLKTSFWTEQTDGMMNESLRHSSREV